MSRKKETMHYHAKGTSAKHSCLKNKKSSYKEDKVNLKQYLGDIVIQ